MRILLKIFAFVLLLFSFFVLYDRYDMRTPLKFEALKQIDPLPHTRALIKEGKLLDAKEYLSFFIPFDYMKNDREAHQLLKNIDRQRAALSYKTKKILSGVITGKSDELSGQISAGVSDFFLLGDLRDLTIEGYHHLQHEKVDKTLVALSSIGVVASAATVMSAGTSTPIKASLSFLKVAKKSGNLPKWLAKTLIKSSKELKQSKNINHLKTLFSDLYHLVDYAGIKGGFKLLKQTKDTKTLKEAIVFSKIYGKNSAPLATILGKDLLAYSKYHDKKAFLYAATYGKKGVLRLGKLGEKGFLKSLKRPIKTSRFVKILGKNSLHLLRQIPDKAFIVLGLVAIMILT